MLRSMKAAVCCVLLPVNATTAADSIAAVGAGTATCGQYMSLYKKNPDETDAVFLSWVDGFYSGMNIAALAATKPSRNLGQPGSRKGLLHTYCDQHPLQDVGQAVTTIYRSFPFNPSAKQ